MGIFSPDGLMPAGAPQSVLNVENQSKLIPQGKQIDLSLTYTNEFASKAS
jgi:NitT/TauT family transport system substrate-binding protein